MKDIIFNEPDSVVLSYPSRCKDNPSYVFINLEDVRAADSIRIHYNFDRDGWVIEQASKFSWSSDDQLCDPCWKQAAFCPAWQFDEDKDEQTTTD